MPIRSTAKPVVRKPLSRPVGRPRKHDGGEVRGDKNSRAAKGSRGKGSGAKGWTPARRAAASERGRELARVMAERRAGSERESAIDRDTDTPYQRAGGERNATAVASATGPAEPTRYETGFDGVEWADAGVRGRVFICGLPGSGKSQLLCDRVRSGRRVIVFDPVNADTLKSLLSDGFVPVSQPGELRALLMRQGGEDFRFLYTPTQGDGLQHFEAVNLMVRKCRHLLYAVDEVDKYQQPGFAPPEFYELLNYGRHAEVAMIGTARRPAQVSKEYTYGLSEVVAFAFTEPGDLKYFEAKCGGTAANQLPSLGKYAYLRCMADGRVSQGSGWR